MDSTVLKIALAGLMHDMGKFAQGGLEITPEYRNNHAGLYQPFWSGHHTHQHVLYTAAFIEQMADVLPDELNAAQWAEGDSFINLAAGHHLPNSPLQWIIAQADRISSGQDRAEFEKGQAIQVRDFWKTRLLTLFEQIDIEGSGQPDRLDQFTWGYPLRCLAADTIFPEKLAVDRKESAAREEYRNLFDQFLEWLPKLKNRENSLNLWVQHFDSLLQSFTSLIPAARVGNVVPDVSLYDHARTTGALAAALYVYHRDTESLDIGAIQDDETEKLMLISGDFFGIQEFIFSEGGETASYRSKLLRGRSFAVSMLSELAADMLCRRIGLPHLCVVLNAAGKFTIIAPNTPMVQNGIVEVRQQVNRWLYGISYGQSSMGFTSTPVAPAEFRSQCFAQMWARHKGEMEKSKSCKVDLDQFGGAVEGYLDKFDNTLNPSLCPFCGKRPSQVGAERDSYLGDSGAACYVCRDHIMLGTRLVKGTRVVVLRSEGVGGLAQRDRLREPLFGNYQVTFANDADLEKLPVENVVKVWNTDVAEDGKVVAPVTSRLINGYVPVYNESDLLDERLMDSGRKPEDLETVRQGAVDGRPMTFADIARLSLLVSSEQKAKAGGTEAIAVLKADVDNLGLLMACGLSEDRYTISRVATLSRQLDSFFSVYLADFLRKDERFRAVYTVFAGGDDLFLIGPWNRMVELALILRERFNAFVGTNDQLHFSAGITMYKPHMPVDKLAAGAEHALEQAKERGRNRVTIFDETVTWQKLLDLVGCGQEMERWLGTYLSGGMFYRFNELIRMAGEEKRLRREKVHISDMQCLRWRSQLHYQLARNLRKDLKGGQRDQALNELQALAIWLETYGGAMRIPLWHILYNQR